jgi:hypothetical protein
MACTETLVVSWDVLSWLASSWIHVLYSSTSTLYRDLHEDAKPGPVESRVRSRCLQRHLAKFYGVGGAARGGTVRGSPSVSQATEEARRHMTPALTFKSAMVDLPRSLVRGLAPRAFLFRPIIRFKADAVLTMVCY